MTDQNLNIGSAEVPLHELLRRIPHDAIYQWENPSKEPWALSSCSSPVGMLAHRAADALSNCPSPSPSGDDVSTVHDWIKRTRLSYKTHGPADAMERILFRTTVTAATLRTLLDNLVIAQGLSREIRTQATEEARAYLHDTRVKPAPARSSLAGGAVTTVPSSVIAACKGEEVRFEAWARSRHCDMTKHPLHYIFSDPKTEAARMGWNAALAYVRDAALSPEAPAREGWPEDDKDWIMDEAVVEKASAATGISDGLVRAAVRAYLDKARDLSSAPFTLAPRHEAPAEPCDSHKAEGYSIDPCCPHCEAPAEGAGGAEKAFREGYEIGTCDGQALDAINDPDAAWAASDTLRARSSALEAREGEVVGWRWRFDNDLSESMWFYGHVVPERPENAINTIVETQPLYTHPAAPSADKLRIAVEALEPFANLGVTSGPDDEPCHYAYRITRGAIRNARQALAALKGAAK